MSLVHLSLGFSVLWCFGFSPQDGAMNNKRGLVLPLKILRGFFFNLIEVVVSIE
jgi:hypothetical protein